MLTDRIEGHWLDAFSTVFDLCRITASENVVILSETQSRAVNIHLAELALSAIGCPISTCRCQAPPIPTGRSCAPPERRSPLPDRTLR